MPMSNAPIRDIINDDLHMLIALLLCTILVASLIAKHVKCMNNKKIMSSIPVWVPDEEIYLHSILKSCENLSKLYLQHYKKCNLLQGQLKLPAIIIGAFTGIASIGGTAFSTDAQKYISFSVGVITICISILNTVESYLKPGENTNSSKTAALGFQQLREDINKELCLPVADRSVSGIIFLRDSYTRYIQIVAQAPILENEENVAYVDTLISRKINDMINARELRPQPDESHNDDVYQSVDPLPHVVVTM